MAPINLFLKHGLMFTTKIEPYSKPFNLTVRGWKVGHYITLDHPAEGNYNLARIAPEAKCRIRYVSEGQAITFSSQTLTALKRPMEIYIIEYPKAITNQISLKKYRPTKTAVPAGITIGTVKTMGMIWDITYEGLQFSTNMDLSLEDVVSLDFEFFTGHKFNNVQARIKNRKIQLRCIEFPYLYGCEFVDLSKEKKEMIQNFLEYCFKQWNRIRKKEQTLVKKAKTGNQNEMF